LQTPIHHTPYPLYCRGRWRDLCCPQNRDSASCRRRLPQRSLSKSVKCDQKKVNWCCIVFSCLFVSYSHYSLGLQIEVNLLWLDWVEHAPKICGRNCHYERWVDEFMQLFWGFLMVHTLLKTCNMQLFYILSIWDPISSTFLLQNSLQYY